ncbi:MAG: universal stress protein [Candidatus Obscuribacterales bacterium]|nr:universal stress protein [Candidatus Obscuribacterales bacterium]
MNILIAVDGSLCSTKAAEFVAERAWRENDSFIILTILEPMPHDLGYGDATLEAKALEDRKNKARCECEAIVDNASSIIKEAHPLNDVKTEIVHGLAVDEIVAFSKTWPADLIVVGSHGRGGLEKILIGSVAERILHQAQCVVEIVKHNPK